MSVSPQQLIELIDAELAMLNDERVVLYIRALLVPPTPVVRDWDYGAPGEAYPCWTVLAHTASNTGIAYCESGFGPRSPWGLVFLTGTSHMSIGMDSGWFASFLEAFFESQGATDLLVWRVFKQCDEPYPGIAITPESDWHLAWEEAHKLRVVDPSSSYIVSHSIPFPRE